MILRWRRVRRVLWGVGVLTACGGVYFGRAGIALSVADHSAPKPACDDWIGQLATVVHGGDLTFRGACAVDPLDGPFSHELLGRVLLDPDRRALARLDAATVLTDRRAELPDAVRTVLDAPTTSPALRRGLRRALLRVDGGAAWEDLTLAPVHGGYDLALLASAVDLADPARAAAPWDGLGPDRDDDARQAAEAALGADEAALRTASARVAAGQLPLGLPLAWWLPLHTSPCAPRDCDALVTRLLDVERAAARSAPAPDVPAIPGDDAVLDLLAGDDADHLREELAAVRTWASDDARRLAVASSLHAPELDAEALLVRAGNVHAAVFAGTGSPGAAAYAAHVAGDADVWTDPDGVRVARGDDARRIGACGSVSSTARPAGAPLDAAQVGALPLVEAAGASLRAHDVGSARVLRDAAAERWPEAPGLDTLTLSVRAAEAAQAPQPSTVASAPAAPGARRGRRSRRAPAPPPPSPTNLLLTQLRALDASTTASAGALLEGHPSGLARTLAAWWAVELGAPELARRLAPGPVAAPYEDVRVATLVRAGEPLRPVGPLSRAWAGKADAGTADCPPAFTPWPATPPPSPK